MAQRKKRAAVTGKASTRGKARTRSKPAPRIAAKRVAGAASSKKRTTKAKSKRAVAKKAALTRAAKQPDKSLAETVIVDVIEQPAPGVTVVTEFEEVRVRGPGETTEQLKGEQGPGPSESKKE
jgi:hypothetical protein